MYNENLCEIQKTRRMETYLLLKHVTWADESRLSAPVIDQSINQTFMAPISPANQAPWHDSKIEETVG